MKEIICKNNRTGNVALTEVPGFPQLGVICEGICAGCKLVPSIRQDIRAVSFAEGEMVKCVPAMMVEGLKAQLAILMLIRASAEEIEYVESKIQDEEQ